MLKNPGEYDTIHLEMRWDFMNQNVLISTALLCSMWDKHNKDTLDLMLPFLKYSIAKQTSVGKVLDIEAVITHFKSEFGYATIPHNVIILMLNRLSPQILKKNNGKYTLIASLDEDLLTFEKNRTMYKERRNKVGSFLAEYLNEHVSKLSSPYTCETALEALISFFVNNGLVLAQNPEQLSLIKKTSDERVEYCIARCIVEEHQNETEIFDYITNMVTGFFVSTAISFQPDNLSMPHSKFRNLECYLDTRVILDALGLRLPSGKIAATELIEMLRSEQTTVCCFRHTVDELRDIIIAYRNSLLSSSKFGSYNTLEHWDEQNYSVEQVNRYLTLLDKKIESLNIKIVPSPAGFQSRVKGLKSLRFQNKLKKNVQYHNDSAYSYDVLSVMGIMRLRNGLRSPELEKCGHIFVTTNIPLIAVLEDSLKDYDASISPAISDVSMSSIVWFKCYSSHKDYPKHKLIDNAMLVLEPSSSVLKELYDEINNLQAEGDLSSDEATIIRTDIHLKRELTASVQGDATLVDKKAVLQIRTRLKERYVGEEKAAADENYRRYLAQKAQSDQALKLIINQIEDAGRQEQAKVTKKLSKIAKWISAILFVIGATCTFVTSLSNTAFLVGAIGSLIIGLFGLYDIFRGRKHIIQKWIDKRAAKAAEQAREEKRREHESVIETLTSPNVLEIL